MSKGLKTTIALSSALVAFMAVSTGVRAQVAGEFDNSSGAPKVEWATTSQGMEPVFSSPSRKPGGSYSQTVEEQNQATSAFGSMNAPSGKRKARSED